MVGKVCPGLLGFGVVFEGFLELWFVWSLLGFAGICLEVWNPVGSVLQKKTCERTRRSFGMYRAGLTFIPVLSLA